MVILTHPVKTDHHSFSGLRSRPCLWFLPMHAWNLRSTLVWLVCVYVCTNYTPHTSTTRQTRAIQTFQDDVSTKLVQLNRTLTCSHLVTPTRVSSLNTFYTKQTSLWWYTVMLLQACLKRYMFTITQLHLLLQLQPILLAGRSKWHLLLAAPDILLESRRLLYWSS